ncbi:hypothetical protein PBY51_014877 [Eleginops maclovinus]|uniref:Uncharacterized protein n=1 Tax=Eleginops maclovinus TaxID=56733 RepID=A0AAN7X379_ELEMC|nr:hypothetical protein PBY51_014877 [Eleginops maclovinus]
MKGVSWLQVTLQRATYLPSAVCMSSYLCWFAVSSRFLTLWCLAEFLIMLCLTELKGYYRLHGSVHCKPPRSRYLTQPAGAWIYYDMTEPE